MNYLMGRSAAKLLATTIIVIFVLSCCAKCQSQPQQQEEGSVEPYIHDTSLLVEGNWVSDYFNHLSSTQIRQLAEDAAGAGAGTTTTTTTDSPYNVAKKVNRYIYDRHDYDEGSKYWESDLEMLQNMRGGLFRGVCIDFAALETSLLRALGIPARVIYAEFDFEGGGHAWVEFFDPEQGWTPADPTFGKFDLEKYYCYFGYDIGEVYTVLNSTKVAIVPGSRYSECTRQSQYLNAVIWIPITLVVLVAAVVLLRSYLVRMGEDEEDAVEESADGTLIKSESEGEGNESEGHDRI